jgi:hypothetical protein
MTSSPGDGIQDLGAIPLRERKSGWVSSSRRGLIPAPSARSNYPGHKGFRAIFEKAKPLVRKSAHLKSASTQRLRISPYDGVDYVVVNDVHETMLGPCKSDHPLAAVRELAQTPCDVVANLTCIERDATSTCENMKKCVGDASAPRRPAAGALREWAAGITR